MTGHQLIAGPYRLDLRDERLWNRDVPVKLGGKSFALLRVLMERPQTLVTKSELFDFVWPGVAVSESVLTTAIKELRQGLGDNARKPAIIQTVHRRGYRFMLPVVSQGSITANGALPEIAGQAAIQAPPMTARKAGLGLRLGFIAAALIIAVTAAWMISGSRDITPHTVAAHPKSIAVLPFEDFTENQDAQWFADGLTDEILDRLTHVPDLRVASRISSLALLNSADDLPDAARTLGFAHVLQGSVRQSDGRIRVTAQLVRVADNVQLWSESYDRPQSDIISIQEDISLKIAAALKTVMDPAKLDAMVKVGTRSVEAYEAYLRGVAFDRRQVDDGGINYARAAADAYEAARTLDPNFAAAHWNAALSWSGNATRINAPMREDWRLSADRRAKFLERLNAAIATSTDETEKLRYRAALAEFQLQLQEAHHLMHAYLKARPRDIDGWDQFADLSAYIGERHALARAAKRIEALSIESGDPEARAITLYVLALQLPDAVRLARRQLELRPDRVLTAYQAHRAFIWAGEIDAGRGLLAQIEASNLPEANRLLSALRQACAEQSYDEAALIRERIDQTGNLTARWAAAQTIGDMDGATALLSPLDTPDSLPQLVQYMIYPTFDSEAYPTLNEILMRNGVRRPHPVATPHSCQKL
ncbi:MAG: winged helix-turn-helix domain-containing protein [Parvularculaceae bacterium]